MITQIRGIAHHRNGVCGAPFHVVLFEEDMVAIVFAELGHCAVLNAPLTAQGEISFGKNSWRGDVFESELREVIKKWEGESA